MRNKIVNRICVRFIYHNVERACDGQESDAASDAPRFDMAERRFVSAPCNHSKHALKNGVESTERIRWAHYLVRYGRRGHAAPKSHLACHGALTSNVHASLPQHAHPRKQRRIRCTGPVRLESSHRRGRSAATTAHENARAHTRSPVIWSFSRRIRHPRKKLSGTRAKRIMQVRDKKICWLGWRRRNDGGGRAGS